jgi:hypothetical protein
MPVSTAPPPETHHFLHGLLRTLAAGYEQTGRQPGIKTVAAFLFGILMLPLRCSRPAYGCRINSLP